MVKILLRNISAIARRVAQKSRNRRPYPSILSSTPHRLSAFQTMAWSEVMTVMPNSASSVSMVLITE